MSPVLYYDVRYDTIRYATLRYDAMRCAWFRSAAPQQGDPSPSNSNYMFVFVVIFIVNTVKPPGVIGEGSTAIVYFGNLHGESVAVKARGTCDGGSDDDNDADHDNDNDARSIPVEPWGGER